jgi:hypothetical protein
MHRGPWWLGRRHGRDACSLGHGRRREGVAGGAVGAESNGGAGKNSAGDGANVLLKWRSGEAMEGGSGDEGATPCNLAVGPGPDRRTVSRPRPRPTAARTGGAALFERGSTGGR